MCAKRYAFDCKNNFACLYIFTYIYRILEMFAIVVDGILFNLCFHSAADCKRRREIDFNQILVNS